MREKIFIVTTSTGSIAGVFESELLARKAKTVVEYHLSMEGHMFASADIEERVVHSRLKDWEDEE